MKDCKRFDCRYRTQQRVVKTNTPTSRYLKLYDGNIYDRKHDKIIDRDTLLDLLNKHTENVWGL